MSGLRATVKKMTKSNRVFPRVCGTRIFNDFGKATGCDKNDRFFHHSTNPLPAILNYKNLQESVNIYMLTIWRPSDMRAVLLTSIALIMLPVASIAQSRAAIWINECGRTAYVRIEFSTGGSSNFRLGVGERHSIQVQRSRGDLWCSGTNGRIDSCRNPAPIDVDHRETLRGDHEC